MEPETEYYASHSVITAPGRYAPWYAPLPEDAVGLCAVVQGLLIHVLHGGRYGVEIPPARMAQVYTYSAGEMVSAILQDDPRPLTAARTPVARFVGTCRHYAVLLCSMLRERSVPARVRNGFSTYLRRDRFSDHWVCEYWDAANGGWRVADAQMDPVHRDVLGIDFDPLDVPRQAQVAAGVLWQRCRRGEVDPALCGSMDIWGLDYVKDNLLRDVAALNKREMLPWDGCALTRRACESMSREELDLLDELAEYTVDAVRVEEIRRLYRDNPALWAKPLPNRHAMPGTRH